MHRGFAPMFGAFVLNEGEVLVEHNAVLAGECDEALAARASDQGQVRLTREFNAPSSKA